MAAKDKKITLKTLHSDIITLKEELNYNKKYLSELQKELKDAKKEIKELKFINNNKKDVPASKCSSTKSFELHNSENHVQRVKCKICDDIFDKNCELEMHIKTQHDSVEKFECDQCGKRFVLGWRLKKHQWIHKGQNIKRCHYFNNKKTCPYEEIGCMFEHSFSGNCRYGSKCDKTMCSFQHNMRAELFDCEDCDFVGKTETELGKHIDEKHEGWRVTQPFCDYFCRVEHNIHICWSNEDFQNFLGFDIWKTCTTMESETVYKCLRCEKTDDDEDKMREHIEENHAEDKALKCNFCDHEDKTWLSLKKHYQMTHLGKH